MLRFRTLTAGALALTSVPLLAIGAVVATAAPAGAANPVFPFDWNIKASTHLNKLDQTVKVPRGSFTGQVDLVTGDLTGKIALPQATSTVNIVGVGLANATFKIWESRPVSGHVDIGTLAATATSVFNMKVVRVSPVGAPSVNLVGDSCVTTNPVKVTMSGSASLDASSTFRGSYTIPPFERCGALTVALNQLVPGPGNTFVAVASPK